VLSGIAALRQLPAIRSVQRVRRLNRRPVLPLIVNPIRDRYRFATAILGGLLLASAFPKLGVAGMGWIAPGILLASAWGADGRLAFRLGYVGGFVFFLGSLSWLLHIPVFKLAPITGWLALSGFLALYPATWVWLCWKTFPTSMAPAGEAWPGTLDRFLETGWTRRAVWCVWCAVLWVGWEMMQARFLSGFPWNLLGSSQFQMIPIIQVAAFTGIYGVSFLMVWFSVAFLSAGVVVLRRSKTPRRWVAEIILPLLVTVAAVAHGVRASVVSPRDDGGRTVRLALVQPSIPQHWIWSPDESSQRFSQLLNLSEQAMAKKPDVLVWPEAAVPGYVRWSTNTHDAVTNLVRRHRTWLILGADDVAASKGSKDGYEVFNASFLVTPQGEFEGRYAKRKLVIFGEYIPFVRWLPFLERWTGMGSFTPGKEMIPFHLTGLDLKTSVLICFEDVFPHVAREHVEEDTDFLLNLTNNGWFGESSAQWQHAAGAVFRAVENGLPLVRCANNGLTCWVDRQGRMHDVFFPGTKDIYGAGVKVVDVPVGPGTKSPTFYRRHGDWFGWACVAISVAGLGMAFIPGLRRRAEQR
jgi:apolipoprotein N-acyltransferase